MLILATVYTMVPLGLMVWVLANRENRKRIFSTRDVSVECKQEWQEQVRVATDSVERHDHAANSVGATRGRSIPAEFREGDPRD